MAEGTHAAPGAGADAADEEAPVLPGAPIGDPAAVAAYTRAVAAAIAAGLGMPPPTAPLPRRPAPTDATALSREAMLAGPLPRVAAGGPPFPAPPPPPPNHYGAWPNPALAAALVAARAATAEGRARVHEAALAWECERDATDALARQIVEAEQLLVLHALPDVGATSSGSTGPSMSHTAVIWHDPANPLVTQLHYQAGGV